MHWPPYHGRIKIFSPWISGIYNRILLFKVCQVSPHPHRQTSGGNNALLAHSAAQSCHSAPPMTDYHQQVYMDSASFPHRSTATLHQIATIQVAFDKRPSKVLYTYWSEVSPITSRYKLSLYPSDDKQPSGWTPWKADSSLPIAAPGE